jgi:hypothetical protein
MTTFDERERSYEAKFAHDAGLRFKATARRDKLLGLWVASQLGLSGAEADEYAISVVRADLKHPGDEDVIEKVLEDLKAKGVAVSEQDVRKKLIEMMATAVAQVEAGH